MATVPVQFIVHAIGPQGGEGKVVGILQVPVPDPIAPSIRDFSEAELLDELRRRSDLRNADEEPF